MSGSSPLKPEGSPRRAEARDEPVLPAFEGSPVWLLLKPKVWNVFCCSRITWMYW
jgi:hypothetical protein